MGRAPHERQGAPQGAELLRPREPGNVKIDIATLRWSKVDSLERLARSLKVALPPHLSGEQYRRRLVRLLAAALEKKEA